jgi:hypothetical protein
MKKAFLLLFVATSALAGKPNWEDPRARYSGSNNMTNQTTITIQNVSNVQAVCEKESKSRGLGGFGYGVDACSFWSGKQCTIILPKTFTKEMLGHETLHCIQGAFH